jgi:Arc/MetJ-type ribon-helix-helix transcriptional regulator
VAFPWQGRRQKHLYTYDICILYILLEVYGMENVRVNVLLPERLLEESRSLVEKGYFGNFSEVVRESLRRELLSYRIGLGEMTEKDRQLLDWVQKEKAAGNILSEKDMAKHGLKV